MSVVATVIVILSYDPDGKTLKAISEFTGNRGGVPLRFGENVCEPVGDWATIDRFIGGTKMAECDIFIGAWNYLDLDGFLAHLATVPWASPEDSCVVIQSCDQEFLKVFKPTDIGKEAE